MRHSTHSKSSSDHGRANSVNSSSHPPHENALDEIRASAPFGRVAGEDETSPTRRVGSGRGVASDDSRAFGAAGTEAGGGAWCAFGVDVLRACGTGGANRDKSSSKVRYDMMVFVQASEAGCCVVVLLLPPCFCLYDSFGRAIIRWSRSSSYILDCPQKTTSMQPLFASHQHANHNTHCFVPNSAIDTRAVLPRDHDLKELLMVPSRLQSFCLGTG